jgi:hypothetical protein
MTMSKQPYTLSGPFFHKQFVDDLDLLAKASDDEVSTLREWLSSLASESDLSDARNWSEIASKMLRPFEEILRLFGPCLAISDESLDESVDVDEVLKALSDIGVFGHGEAQKQLLARVRPLCNIFIKWRLARPRPPSLPLLNISRIHTRCILTSEYDREYNVTRDTSDSYEPSLLRLHPAVTLHLRFRDEQHEPIGVVLTPAELRSLKRRIELAEVQLKTTAASLRDAEIVDIEAD